jgi:NitT/TauT family transport system ATP-binding protein
MTADAPVRVRLIGLCKSYEDRRRGRVEVLRDVNLEVRDGEFVCIVGASGCGKTTLVRIVDGLIPWDSGEVLVDDRSVHEPGPERAFVFQGDSLYPWRTVADNAGFGLEVQDKPRSESRSVVERLLRLVGLSGFADHYPHELSGGMRQRVNLARALAVDPDVLLMDEPFASLDAQTREIMQRELLGIWRNARKTVIFITHQIDEAVYLGDRVVVLSARPGRVREDLRIDLPRPRALSIKRTPEFGAYAERIWKLVEDEVLASMSVGGAGV